MNNPLQFVQAMRNPQAFMQQMMNSSQVAQNPMIKNAMGMMNSGDTKGLEQMARNLCKEKNINVDEAVQQIKNQFGMK